VSYALATERRFFIDYRDPDWEEAKVLCPNPVCDGGEVVLLAVDLRYTCPLCEGDGNCWPSDVSAYAAAVGVELVVDEGWVFGPQPGDEL
jgi:hypothetical protein